MISNLSSRFECMRYRLVHLIVVIGALVLGLLILGNLYEHLRPDFQDYYGISGIETDTVNENLDALLPITVVQLIIGLFALIGTFWFIASERYRLRKKITHHKISMDKGNYVHVSRPSFSALFDELVLRGSAFAGLLMSGWLLQTSLERHLAGIGWGMEYEGWQSVIALASVFGLSVLVGVVVACFSMVGLRAITVLEIALSSIRKRLLRNSDQKLPKHWGSYISLRTIREVFGYEILSRPPPYTVASQ